MRSVTPSRGIARRRGSQETLLARGIAAPRKSVRLPVVTRTRNLITPSPSTIRLARLGFEVRAELQLGEGDALTAQLSRAEADLLELAEGQIVHVRVEPVSLPAT